MFVVLVASHFYFEDRTLLLVATVPCHCLPLTVNSLTKWPCQRLFFAFFFVFCNLCATNTTVIMVRYDRKQYQAYPVYSMNHLKVSIFRKLSKYMEVELKAIIMPFCFVFARGLMNSIS